MPGNGDDSGAVSYHTLTPVLGATFRLTQDCAVSADQAGLNFGLAAARSDNFELGIKAKLDERMQASVAAFHIATANELAVLANAGGRTVYQNAGATRRDGIEASVKGDWKNGIGMVLAYSWLRAVYAQPFCSGACTPATMVAAGNRLPGVPNQTLYGELSWRHAASGFSAALEGRYSGRMLVDDLNSDAASGYVLTSLRAGFERSVGGWTLKSYARINNLADRCYAGSVIVNESNRRFFEPAPGRSWPASALAMPDKGACAIE
ncbi:protein of unknown function [Candidatus Nitrotoga arctica]|uniref:TonB-dependent receptor-like beta-barrel domain-containing protein n=1 Tax=Candidatus Nitrotoga arctica TaxID=453162 RepID=A0ABM8Z0H0_9PROT|nr:TonB-dependent receptor [Candidatus Nitrotoga arctica]CAG9933330.1 protein of unknown function [Candidatus Nitrotoga arctica]